MNCESFLKKMSEMGKIKIEYGLKKREANEEIPDYNLFSYDKDYFYSDPTDEYDYSLANRSRWNCEPDDAPWTPSENPEGWSNFASTQVINLNPNEITSNNNWSKKDKKKKVIVLNRYFTNGEQPKPGVFSTISTNKKFDFSYVLECKNIKKKKCWSNPKLFTQDVIYPRNIKTAVVIRCQNCRKTDHLSKDCPDSSNIFSEDICFICLSKFHKKSSCPNRPCLRCNRKGHFTSYCPRTKQYEICDSCKISGHLAEDCLRKPLHISSKSLENYTCYFCNKTGHLICPLTITNSIIDSDLENELRMESLDDSSTTEKEDQDKKVKRGKIKFKKSCPKCADEHSLKDCGRSTKKSKEDTIRKDLSLNYFTSGSKLINDKNFMNFSDSD